MSNYPPGVSGNEYQIAGPSSERDETLDVGNCTNPDCEFEGGEVAGVLVDHVWFDWACPLCDRSHTMDVEPPEAPEREYGDWDYR